METQKLGEVIGLEGLTLEVSRLEKAIGRVAEEWGSGEHRQGLAFERRTFLPVWKRKDRDGRCRCK